MTRARVLAAMAIAGCQPAGDSETPVAELARTECRRPPSESLSWLPLDKPWLRDPQDIEFLIPGGGWIHAVRPAAELVPVADAARRRAQAQLRSVTDPCALQFTMVAYVASFAMFYDEAETIRALPADVPASSPAWAANPHAVAYAYGVLAQERPAYVAALHEHAAKEVRGWAAGMALVAAAQRADLDAERRWHATLTETNPSGPMLVEIVTMLDPDRPLAPGAIVPPMSFPAFDGGTAGTETLRGHRSLVVAWATWCEPCMEELPGLIALAERNPDLEVLAINAESEAKTSDLDAAREAIGSQERPPNWHDVYANPVTELRATWGLGGLPMHILLDEDGKVLRGPPFSELSRITPLLTGACRSSGSSSACTGSPT